MRNSILIKLRGRENGVLVKTVSRNHPLTDSFYILRKDLETLAYKEHITVKDCSNFADMHTVKVRGGLILVQIDLYWLNGNGQDISGWTETIRVPLGTLMYNAGRDGSNWKGLSFTEERPILYEFHASHLHDVVENPALRRKFSKFISTHFNWPSAEKIVIWNDWNPYDFYFEEYTPYGKGVCGGIILHESDDIRNATYGMHT